MAVAADYCNGSGDGGDDDAEVVATGDCVPDVAPRSPRCVEQGSAADYADLYEAIRPKVDRWQLGDRKHNVLGTARNNKTMK